MEKGGITHIPYPEYLDSIPILDSDFNFLITHTLEGSGASSRNQVPSITWET